MPDLPVFALLLVQTSKRMPQRCFLHRIRGKQERLSGAVSRRGCRTERQEAVRVADGTEGLGGDVPRHWDFRPHSLGTFFLAGPWDSTEGSREGKTQEAR